MALRRDGTELRTWTLAEVYAAADPNGWDAIKPRPELRLVNEPTEWTNFDLRTWTRWDKWLRRYSLGFMRHPSSRTRNASRRFMRGTRGRWVTGDIGIVDPVRAACELAGLTSRQIEVWVLAEGEQLSQRAVALALHISQPMIKKHLANARSRLAQEWGVITSGLVIGGTERRALVRPMEGDHSTLCPRKLQRTRLCVSCLLAGISNIKGGADGT